MGILEVFVLVVGIVSSYSTLSSKMESKRIWIFVAVIAVFAASQAWAIKCFIGGGGDVGTFKWNPFAKGRNMWRRHFSMQKCHYRRSHYFLLRYNHQRNHCLYQYNRC